MNSNQLVELTKRLVAIESTASNPAGLRAALNCVVQTLRESGQDITIEKFERNGKPSFLAYRKGKRPEKFDVLLNAHLDVVPGEPELFAPYEKDGNLYGRGVLDMKGTAVVLADVFCEFVNNVPYALGLQMVTDEELGGYDGVKLQLDDGVRANFVIMGEYANHRNTIYNAARGLCWAEILFSGKAAHGGHLWHGDNAVVKAGAFAGAVLKRYPTPDRETWTTTASISSLSTPNDTFNKVPHEAILKIDFRFTQEDPVFRSCESLEAFIHEIDPQAKLIATHTFEPAVFVEELNPYVQGLSQALKSVTKKQPKYLGRPASSDGRHFALVQNDIVEFGLYGQGSHSNGEYVEISSFAEYQQAMRAFLRQPIPAKLKTSRASSEPLHEQLLRQLVAMPTVSKDFAANNNALAFIEKFLAERGMFVEKVDINGFRSIIATTKPGNRRPAVLLNAHMDVVPATRPDQFNLTLKDGKFYGRGVMDMKHAIATYMTVVDSLKDELGAYDFGIMITSDEELGSNYGAKPLVEMGYRPKVVIVPDGGNNWQLETFAKGVKWVELTATGKAAHASRPWEGESAIQKLLDAIEDIKKLVPANPKPTDTFLSVGTINGGTTANQIPVLATAMLDVRTGSVEDHKRLTPQIQEICQKHDVAASFHADEPPLVSDPQDPFIKPMVDIVTQITGEQHETSYDYAVTDGRIFSTVGVPTIVINPECGNIHREDEWLGRKSFGQFCEVIELYVRKMAHVATPEPDKSEYVWYATYGSGLSKEHFLLSITGADPAKTMRHNVGCSNKSEPLKDTFISLPYKLFFAGHCEVHGGGHAYVDYRRDENAHTIARAYLITREQFEEIACQENLHQKVQNTPFKEATRHGHATIGYNGDYDELLYCGDMDGYPIYSLTTSNPDAPHTAPAGAYTDVIRKGLSEATAMDAQTTFNEFLETTDAKETQTPESSI